MSEIVNQLILGDNLEVLKTIPKESIDLIYLDPPFFSNRNYEVIWGDEGEIRSFKDRWSGGIDHYIGWLKERVEEMFRTLKPTGSIFLHCDWHADAYIRVDVLDKIFGPSNFKNEIIWQRTNSKGLSFTRLAQNHDSIFYYTKSNVNVWNPIYLPHNEKYLTDFYKYTEPETGRIYRLADLTNPNHDRPNLTYEFLGIQRVWRWTRERMQEAYENGLVIQTKPGTVPQLKRYLDEQEGNPLDDNWVDISTNKLSKKERIGYPTQKPEALLERILTIASNEGDIVMDPFCGGGTTCAVADKLRRQWICIDSSVSAIKVSEFRLNNQQDLFSRPFIVKLYKYDYDTLRYKNAFEFESWIIEQFDGVPNTKKRNDLGLDGVTREKVPIQVKRSDNIGRNVIDNFHSAVQRFDKGLYDKNKSEASPIGYIIAFSFGKGAVEEVARLKVKEGVIIKLITVETIVPIAKKPGLSVVLNDKGEVKKGTREIEIQATGISEAGVEFYAWDTDYNEQRGFKPEVLIDKEGIQVFKFKPGIHQIAVKVVDMEGLENLEVIRLKVNGAIEKF
jgi:DNA modification methylase